ncbi:MAG TPA: hypothetical protein VMT85_17480 [Thermoanaerobaculia bacterium]|nr:hypothetical protein [Thermoanaerobaculia bacterium]
MGYQIDARDHSLVRVGRDDQEVAVFRKAGSFIHNLEGEVDGVEYQMKLAAPWTGFRYLLRQGTHELASAKRRGRLHAFEADRPLVRHRLVEFELEVHGRQYRLTPEDRYGLTHALCEGDEQCGGLVMRTFEAQRDGPWQADLQAPSDWPVPLAAFVAWLAREGRGRMGG